MERSSSEPFESRDDALDDSLDEVEPLVSWRGRLKSVDRGVGGSRLEVIDGVVTDEAVLGRLEDDFIVRIEGAVEGTWVDGASSPSLEDM